MIEGWQGWKEGGNSAVTHSSRRGGAPTTHKKTAESLRAFLRTVHILSKRRSASRSPSALAHPGPARWTIGQGRDGGWQMAENLSAGVRVRLHSLQAAAQHNGVDGHLLKWNASTGRWGVKLSTGQELSVRPANVICLLYTSDAADE